MRGPKFFAWLMAGVEQLQVLARPCELQGAAQACDWVGEIGVEKAPHVIYFRDAGEVVIAKAEVESELRGQLPVVLNIGEMARKRAPYSGCRE